MKSITRLFILPIRKAYIYLCVTFRFLEYFIEFNALLYMKTSTTLHKLIHVLNNCSIMLDVALSCLAALKDSTISCSTCESYIFHFLFVIIAKEKRNVSSAQEVNILNLLIFVKSYFFFKTCIIYYNNS